MTPDLLLPTERSALDLLEREAVELIVANRHRDADGTTAEDHADRAACHAERGWAGIDVNGICNRDEWFDDKSGKLALSHALARMVLALAKVGT